MTASSSFWDRLADRYAAQPIADEASYQAKLSTTRGYLRPDMELLEFGCGTGSTALAHAPHVRHITAIDYSARMIGIAQGKARAAGIDNVTFEQADIGEFAARRQTYDMVLGLSILHLLKHPAATITQVFDMLRPGGLFVTSTACLGDTAPWFKLLAPIGRSLNLLPQLTVMTSDELRRHFRDAGFAIEHDWLPGRGKALFIIARRPTDVPAALPQPATVG